MDYPSDIKITEQDTKRFINIVKRHSQYDFSDYSIKSLTRRIDRILKDYMLDIDTLIERIIADKKFLEEIVKAITVNTTELFRDPEMWEELLNIIPNFFPNVQELRIWHPGVSSGQELYSMEIILHILGKLDQATIFGTDINVDILEIAKKGSYKIFDFDNYLENFQKALRNFPQIKFEHFFTIDEKKDTYEVKPLLKEYPIFLKHDLVNDGNIFGTKFHIIMCRNVLIYFNHNLQNKIVNFFYKNLYKRGILIIGRHESIINKISDKFENKNCIYLKEDI